MPIIALILLCLITPASDSRSSDIFDLLLSLFLWALFIGAVVLGVRCYNEPSPDCAVWQYKMQQCHGDVNCEAPNWPVRPTKCKLPERE